MRTLDSYHKGKVISFEMNRDALASINLRIAELIDSPSTQSGLLIPIETKVFFGFGDLRIKLLKQPLGESKLGIKNKQLKEKKRELEELYERKRVLIEEKKRDEVGYYAKVMDLLVEYYDRDPKPITKKERNILEFIQQKNNKNESSLQNFVEYSVRIDKTKIYEDYMTRLGRPVPKKTLKYAHSYTFCDSCKADKKLDVLNSSYICVKCGECYPTLIDSEKTPYTKDPIIETNNFSYKRYDHFVEWLTKFQNNARCNIPKKIYNIILKELKRRPFDSSKTKVSIETVKDILNKTNNAKYNDQASHIMTKLNSKPVPKLPKDVQEKMKHMFKQTQKPFSKICPNDRTNFLSYSYVIRKFLELLKQYKYVEYFPLLKSREKLYHQDLMWKSICGKLNWEYKPSI